MSDVGYERLGRSLADLGMTIAGKLDDAEKASEYMNGYDTLRRGLAKFDAQLETDPDWQSYPEKADKAENELWTQVEKATRHQGAKNDLEQTFVQMRDSHYQEILGIQNRVRSRTLFADLVKRIDSRAKEVQQGIISAAQAEALDSSDLTQASRTSIIDPTQAYETLQKSKRGNQLAEIYLRIGKIARDPTQGWAGAITQVPSIVSEYPEINNEQDIQAIMRHSEALANVERVKQNRAAKDNNDKIDDAVMDAMKTNDLGKAWQILNSGKYMDEEGKAAGSDRWWAMRQRLEEYARQERENKRAQEKDNPYFMQLKLQAIDEGVPYEQVLENARNLTLTHDITPDMYEAVKKLEKPRMDQRSHTFEEPFDAGARDTNNSPEVQNQYKAAIADWRFWWSTHGDKANLSESEAEQQRILDMVKHKTATDSVNKAFGPTPTEQAGAAVRSVARGQPGYSITAAPKETKTPPSQETVTADFKALTSSQLEALPKRPGGSKALYRVGAGGKIYAYIETAEGYRWTRE
jgi:hypothetical protein